MRKYRIVSFLLLICLLFSSVQTFNAETVYATEQEGATPGELWEWMQEQKAKEEVEPDLVAAVKDITGTPKNEALQASIVGIVIAGLRQDGYSSEAIAGVLANMQHESGFNPMIWIGKPISDWSCYAAFLEGEKEYTYENPNTEGGFGLCQWTFDRHVRLSNYCKDSGQAHILVRGAYRTSPGGGTQNETYACDAGTQIAFLIQEGNEGWTQGNAKKVGLPIIDKVKEFKTLSSAENAAMYWCLEWERPKNMEERAKERAANAQAWLSIVNGKYDWSNYIDKTQASIVAKQLVGAGYWNEEQLGAYCRVLEINVDNILSLATREGLGFNEMEGLAAWERNIKYDNEDSGLIGWLRRIIMIMGIIFIIWVTLIYCAYWFDRVNPFYIDALGILTLGHLHMSETEEECTFRAKNLGKGDRKTVNHRAILFICLIGVAFGVLIISGWFYVVLRKWIWWIQRLLRKV